MLKRETKTTDRRLQQFFNTAVEKLGLTLEDWINITKYKKKRNNATHLEEDKVIPEAQKIINSSYPSESNVLSSFKKLLEVLKKLDSDNPKKYSDFY